MLIPGKLPALNKVLILPFPFGREEMDVAVSFLENLTKVSRFDMLVMCLTSKDRAGKDTLKKTPTI